MRIPPQGNVSRHLLVPGLVMSATHGKRSHLHRIHVDHVAASRALWLNAAERCRRRPAVPGDAGRRPGTPAAAAGGRAGAPLHDRLRRCQGTNARCLDVGKHSPLAYLPISPCLVASCRPTQSYSAASHSTRMPARSSGRSSTNSHRLTLRMSCRVQTVLPLHAADYELLRQLQGALARYPPTAAVTSAP